MSNQEVLRLTRVVAARPADVWNCFTKPECLQVWWQDNIEFEASLGGRFAEPWLGPDGSHRLTRAQVTAFHPPRGLVMVWADEDWTFDTVVSFWMEEVPGGTEVRIEHQGWEQAPELERESLLQDHREGWTTHLANLAAHAEGHHARRRGH